MHLTDLTIRTSEGPAVNTFLGTTYGLVFGATYGALSLAWGLNPAFHGKIPFSQVARTISSKTLYGGAVACAFSATDAFSASIMQQSTAPGVKLSTFLGSWAAAAVIGMRHNSIRTTVVSGLLISGLSLFLEFNDFDLIGFSERNEYKHNSVQSETNRYYTKQV
eukprot:snap_masked-scaffold_5-processed-gene-3.17-mRNA-1 protein AED:1.00 eAED:1.00 QI:0/-1/0/0/-1/1/1/0/163